MPCPSQIYLKVKHFLENLHRVFGAGDSVADSPRVGKDFIVVPTLVRLITEKVNLLEVFLFNMLQSISLVPSVGAIVLRLSQCPEVGGSAPHSQDVKRDLSSNGISEVKVSKLLLQGEYKCSSHLMYLDHGTTMS